MHNHHRHETLSSQNPEKLMHAISFTIKSHFPNGITVQVQRCLLTYMSAVQLAVAPKTSALNVSSSKNSIMSPFRIKMVYK